jgi:hypothetical protein
VNLVALPPKGDTAGAGPRPSEHVVRADDWTASATRRAAANGTAPNPTKPVTLTQARFFMDHGTYRASVALDAVSIAAGIALGWLIATH